MSRGWAGRRRAPRTASIEERLDFYSVDAPSGCRIWIGARNKPGYGRLQVDGQCGYAHRINYELRVGPIPAGMQLDHLCRRPACIRVDHLQPVTPQVNVRRGTGTGARALRRDRCLRGHAYADHGVVRSGRRVCRVCQIEYSRIYGSLWPDEIDRRRAAGVLVVDLDAAFGISA